MHSKETENYKLPQWLPKDHPDFLTDLNEAMATIDDGMHKNNVDVKGLKEDFDAMAVHVDELDTTVAALKEKVDNLVDLDQNPIFIALQDRVTEAEANITKLQEDVELHTADIASIRKAITNIETSIAEMQHTLDDHATELEDHHNAITSILSEQETIREKLGDLQNDIDILEKQVDSNTANITKNTNAIAEQKGAITNLTDTVGELNSTVEQLSAGVGEAKDIPIMKGEGWDEAEFKPSLMQLEKSYGLLRKHVQNIDTLGVASVPAMKGDGWDEAEHKPSLMSLQTELNSTDSMVETLQDDMVQAKADITGLNTAMEGEQTAINNLIGRVSLLEEGGGGAVVEELSDIYTNSSHTILPTETDTLLLVFNTTGGVSCSLYAVAGNLILGGIVATSPITTGKIGYSGITVTPTELFVSLPKSVKRTIAQLLSLQSISTYLDPGIACPNTGIDFAINLYGDNIVDTITNMDTVQAVSLGGTLDTYNYSGKSTEKGHLSGCGVIGFIPPLQ